MFRWLKDEINNIYEKDPAIKSKMEVFLYPSFHAAINHKLAHWLYKKKRFFLATPVQVPDEPTAVTKTSRSGISFKISSPVLP